MGPTGQASFRWRMIGAVGLVVAVAIAAAIAMKIMGGPRIAGRSAQQWLGELDSQDPQARARVEVALQELGPAVVPVLMRSLTYREPAWVSWMHRHVRPQAPWWPVSGTESGVRSFAFRGFRALGPRGASALPELRRHLTDPENAWAASIALVYVAPQEAQVLADTWMQDTNRVIRLRGMQVRQEILHALLPHSSVEDWGQARRELIP